VSGHGHAAPSADGTAGRGREILTDYGRLIVSECDDGDIVPGCAHVTVDPGCAHVTVDGKPAAIPAGQFPHLIAALYEASGEPAPVILDGYGDAGVTEATIGGVRVYLAEGRRVGIDGNDDLPPALARQIARMLVSIADLADAEPDPAEVEAIVAKIGEEIGGAWVGRDLRIARAAARSALRSVREREATP
jgi:hypothetical protein